MEVVDWLLLAYGELLLSFIPSKPVLIRLSTLSLRDDGSRFDVAEYLYANSYCGPNFDSIDASMLEGVVGETREATVMALDPGEASDGTVTTVAEIGDGVLSATDDW